MTKSKMAEFFKRFDDEKFNTFKHGTDFELVVHDQAHGTYMHTGIGSGESMSKMCLFSLCSLYEMGAEHDRATIEKFAESVKELLIKAYNEDIFELRRIDDESKEE